MPRCKKTAKRYSLPLLVGVIRNLKGGTNNLLLEVCSTHLKFNFPLLLMFIFNH